MKNSIIKYIFIFFVVILIIFSIFKFQKDDNKKENHQSNVEQSDEEIIEDDIRLAVINYDTINPILSNNNSIQELSRLIYEPLITLNEDYKLESCLAKEWSKSGDNSYIIKLKNNIKWHDGSLFTSKDVQFTIDKLKNISSIYSYNVQHVVQVETIDDYTIKISLDDNDSFFDYKLTFPILSSNYYENEDFQSTAKNNSPIGTGMFKISSNENGAIVLSKNEDWWNKNNKDSKIKEIKVKLYSSMGDAYNEFKMGNIDMLTTENSDYEKYIGTIGYNKVEYKDREFDFLAFNCKSVLLSDKNVRKAISCAIDKDNIIATVFNGKYYPMNYPLDFGMWLYSSDVKDIEFNPEQAKQILTDNGWTYKYNSWQKNIDNRYYKLSLNFVVDSNNDLRMKVAEIIKQNLEAIGIPIKIYGVSNSLYKYNLENKSYDLILAGTNIGLSPNLNTYFGDSNLADFSNEEVNIIMKEIKNITDEKEIKEKYKRLQEIYVDENPYKSMYINKKTIISNINLVGDIKPNIYGIYYNIENWYRKN